MNRQYRRPQLHYIYLLYIFYSIVYLISLFLCISIREPGVLQQQSKRASLEEKEGRTMQGPGLSKSSQASPPRSRIAWRPWTDRPACSLSVWVWPVRVQQRRRLPWGTTGQEQQNARPAGRCATAAPDSGQPKAARPSPAPLAGCALEIPKVVQPDIKNRWVRISF